LAKPETAKKKADLPDRANARSGADLATVGDVATQLAEALDDGDVLFLALDEQRALAIHAALAAAAPEAVILHCPSSDALPGDPTPASPGNVGRRVAALHRVRLLTKDKAHKAFALISTGEAAARFYPTPKAFDVAPPIVSTGDALDIAKIACDLAALGYIDDERVDEPGEIAVRGQVVDIFPADAGDPVRLEIEDGLVTAIRAFEASSQRGVADLETVEIGRASEPVLEGTGTTLFDHLPSAAIFLDPGVESRRDRFAALAADAARRRGADTAGSAATAENWRTILGNRKVRSIEKRSGGDPEKFAETPHPLRSGGRAIKTAAAAGERVLIVGAERDLRFLKSRIAKLAGVESLNPAASWSEACRAKPGSIMTLPMPADKGWRTPDVLVIAAADILGSRALRGDPVAGPSFVIGQGDSEIRLGDVVVHEEFGIGVIAGLQKLDAHDGTSDEAIVLEYAAGGRRAIPVSDADRIWRYGADADAVSLDRLDGATWQKRRAAIDAAIAESAVGLAALAAARAGRSAQVIDPAAADYERFAAGFAFTETPDQARAIEAVRRDLVSGTPMDRLVVGDVGYGKTEVAMRAAALVALAGKQVAIAAPTTVLVRQHLESFAARFDTLGIEVVGLSRLTGATEKKRVKAGLADGSISIVIGTGAVAGTGIAYKDLALVVVDEEQRFGAADKQKLRALCDGHVLTLSATPIPRTLQMALVGLQDVSVIATPPARRQPIRTAIAEFDPATMRTALMREKMRGGQSFVVVARIEDMEPISRKLPELVPELSVRQAHGKLPAAEIDEAMVAFAGGDGDVLLATNIIEAGLDVPRANTMIVWRADRFGLSQLHQLRGRVGRGGRRGQILLFTEAGAKIADSTLKRLNALAAFDRLGAGFEISARDLDLRGAGDLLGEAQAGHMKLIGVDLYQHLLGRALRAARGERIDDWMPELKVDVAGAFPEAWIPESDVRIALYCRLARLRTTLELNAFEDELEDRFGALPPAAQMLVHLQHIRRAAHTAGVTRIDAGPEAIAFTGRGTIDLSKLGFEKKGERWLLAERLPNPENRVQRILECLDELIDPA
jgi:transcription-repair coupling factor (superfamily II helicase)